MNTFRHNGVLIPDPYPPRNLAIRVKGHPVALTPLQEEMAVAWAKKQGTPYVDDPVFQHNFFKDFQRALKLKGQFTPHDFDFEEVNRAVQADRAIKAALSPEERKRQAEDRKKTREANKEIYGYAEVDGIKVEIGNYTVEPSSIFMGRGKHPHRGRWKEGPQKRDIILNLIPTEPKPEGWKAIESCPNSLWIAKWKDKLSGRMKYVWLADSAFIKQQREQEKYDKAQELRVMLSKVRDHYYRRLDGADARDRKLATVCYLIDHLALRVGDEKNEDEADTVGATTLRPEHVEILANRTVKFSFLGKDSVPWNRIEPLTDSVRRNLAEFMGAIDDKDKKTPIFKGIGSEQISAFLSEVMPGLTAKVFRTFQASEKVQEYLYGQPVAKEDPEYEKKKVATLANLQAAVICNHMKQLPKNYQDRLKKQETRVKQSKKQVAALRAKLAEEQNRVAARKKSAKTKASKTKLNQQLTRLKHKSEERIQKATAQVEKMKTQLDLMTETGQYNLGTSLKNYIDPRIYKDWGERVDYPWRKYYSSALQKKFSWMENSCHDDEDE